MKAGEARPHPGGAACDTTPTRGPTAKKPSPADASHRIGPEAASLTREPPGGKTSCKSSRNKVLGNTNLVRTKKTQTRCKKSSSCRVSPYLHERRVRVTERPGSQNCNEGRCHRPSRSTVFVSRQICRRLIVFASETQQRRRK